MVKHALKIGDEYLNNLISGRKRVEIRLNDRDYQVGDSLEFKNIEGYHYFEITHVHSGLGMSDGYVALSVISEVEQAQYESLEALCNQ